MKNRGAGTAPPLLPALPRTRIHARLGQFDTVIETEQGLGLRFDGEGRWCSLRLRTAFFRRLIDGGVVRSQGPGRAPIDVMEPATVHRLAGRVASRIQRAIAHAVAPLVLAGASDDPAVLRQRLSSVREWTPAHLEGERERFRRSYPEPIPILPPDRTTDIVVLPATGCPYRQCSFCAFYRERPFRRLSREELAAHVASVQECLGSSTGWRQGIFLGSGNALALSTEHLLQVLDLVLDRFEERRRGVAAFWDPDHSPRRTHGGWRRLAQSGLRRVYAGLETGDPPLRRSLGKHEDTARFVQRIQEARLAGLSVGITVLAGLGEGQVAARHKDRTQAVLKAMDLGDCDTVFVSPLQDAVRPSALEQEARSWTAALRTELTARVALYCMDRFRYYA